MQVSRPVLFQQAILNMNNLLSILITLLTLNFTFTQGDDVEAKIAPTEEALVQYRDLVLGSGSWILRGNAIKKLAKIIEVPVIDPDAVQERRGFTIVQIKVSEVLFCDPSIKNYKSLYRLFLDKDSEPASITVAFECYWNKRTKQWMEYSDLSTQNLFVVQYSKVLSGFVSWPHLQIENEDILQELFRERVKIWSDWLAPK